jgi:putative transposase
MWRVLIVARHQPLQVVAIAGKLPFRTAQRWVSGYRKFGLAALARKPRADRGVRRVISTKLKEAVQAPALESPPLPVRSIWRQIRQYAETIGEPPPRYGIVYDLVREMPVGLLTLAHRGGKTYSEQFDLVHRREAPRSNAISQADHAQLDIRFVREDGLIDKPWLTIVIDDYSRAIAGYFLGFDPPSSTRIALALRQAIWRKGHPHWQVCGIPEVLYTDDGSDFKSKHIEQVAVDLKIQLVFSTPGKPQGRGRMERFFRTINEMFLCELDGFGKQKRRKPSLSMEQFEERFRTFLFETYHRQRNKSLKTAPAARWEEGGFLPRIPESLEQLDLLLMQAVGARKVRRDGIHFQGLRYLSLVLAAYVGEEVTIRYDPRDMGEIRVFFKDRFLCSAVSAELAGEIISLRDITRARDQRRRELSTVLHDRQRVVDSLLQLKKGTSPEEIHAQAVAATPSQIPDQKVPQRVAALSLKQSNTAGLQNFVTHAATSVTSDYATGHQVLAKRFLRFATVTPINFTEGMHGQLRWKTIVRSTLCSTRPL